ncbi:MAG: hypothetical protein FIA95_08180 [Gemmatimonadetes bacterium]|nr:hypothetical protein [Gemmatimonadota bacterium]
MDQNGRVDPEWHSYRCPVCGHTDEVALEDGPSSTVPCSHCTTPLEIVVRSPDQASVAVKVATRWRRVR